MVVLVFFEGLFPVLHGFAAVFLHNMLKSFCYGIAW